MQNEANYTAELLIGDVNQEQVEQLKLLLVDNENENAGANALYEYLKNNVINKNTRDAVVYSVGPWNSSLLISGFYRDIDKIYKIALDDLPKYYEKLSNRLKETEAELASVKKSWKQQYDKVQDVIGQHMAEFEQDALEALMAVLDYDPDPTVKGKNNDVSDKLVGHDEDVVKEKPNNNTGGGTWDASEAGKCSKCAELEEIIEGKDECIDDMDKAMHKISDLIHQFVR